MAMDYYSFERVLKELQMEEDELKRLVSEGEIRAFRDDDKMKFRKSDIDGLKKGRMTEPTIILPSGEPDDSSEDSEVLLVEEDTSETLLDIDDLEGADSSSTVVPTVDLTSSEFGDPSSASETITEELTFEEDSGSYVLESSDDVLIDSSDELTTIDDDSATGGETFIDSDTGLQTEPLDMDMDMDMDLDMDMDMDSSDLDVDLDSDITPAIDDTPMTEQQTGDMLPEPPMEDMPGTRMVRVAPVEEPLPPAMMFFLIAATVLMLFSGMVMINVMKEVDTPVTGWLTDITYRLAPARHLCDDRGEINDNKLQKHLIKRQNWRDRPGSVRGSRRGR